MDFLKDIKSKYTQTWQHVIQPVRQDYFIFDLGPRVQVLNGMVISRQDFELTNTRGETLQCSLFSAEKYIRKSGGCVVYLHGNGGSRIEAIPCLEYLLPQTAVFAFDFAGAGKSGGSYVTLGLREADDLAVIVNHIKNHIGIPRIALWGRSMGAVTALQFCAVGKQIQGVTCLALDSAFTRLDVLLEEIGRNMASAVPGFLVDAGLVLIRSKITSVLEGLNIFELDVLEKVESISEDIAGIFVCAHTDIIVAPWHTEKLHATFKGEKRLLKFNGDHNSHRPQWLYQEIADFLQERLYRDPREVIKLGGVRVLGSSNQRVEQIDSIDERRCLLPTPPPPLQLKFLVKQQQEKQLDLLQRRNQPSDSFSCSPTNHRRSTRMNLHPLGNGGTDFARECSRKLPRESLISITEPAEEEQIMELRRSLQRTEMNHVTSSECRTQINLNECLQNIKKSQIGQEGIKEIIDQIPCTNDTDASITQAGSSIRESLSYGNTGGMAAARRNFPSRLLNSQLLGRQVDAHLEYEQPESLIRSVFKHHGGENEYHKKFSSGSASRGGSCQAELPIQGYSQYEELYEGQSEANSDVPSEAASNTPLSLIFPIRSQQISKNSKLPQKPLLASSSSSIPGKTLFATTLQNTNVLLVKASHPITNLVSSGAIFDSSQDQDYHLLNCINSSGPIQSKFDNREQNRQNGQQLAQKRSTRIITTPFTRFQPPPLSAPVKRQQRSTEQGNNQRESLPLRSFILNLVNSSHQQHIGDALLSDSRNLEKQLNLSIPSHISAPLQNVSERLAQFSQQLTVKPIFDQNQISISSPIKAEPTTQLKNHSNYSGIITASVNPQASNSGRLRRITDPFSETSAAIKPPFKEEIESKSMYENVQQHYQHSHEHSFQHLPFHLNSPARQIIVVETIKQQHRYHQNQQQHQQLHQHQKQQDGIEHQNQDQVLDQHEQEKQNQLSQQSQNQFQCHNQRLHKNQQQQQQHQQRDVPRHSNRPGIYLLSQHPSMSPGSRNSQSLRSDGHNQVQFNIMGKQLIPPLARVSAPFLQVDHTLRSSPRKPLESKQTTNQQPPPYSIIQSSQTIMQNIVQIASLPFQQTPMQPLVGTHRIQTISKPRILQSELTTIQDIDQVTKSTAINRQPQPFSIVNGKPVGTFFPKKTAQQTELSGFDSIAVFGEFETGVHQNQIRPQVQQQERNTRIFSSTETWNNQSQQR